MLQHEMDHLDGVLILDRAPREQRKGALRALREGGSYSPHPEGEEAAGGGASRAANRRVRTVYLGTSEFAAAVLRRLAGSPHRPAPRRHTARPPPGARAQDPAAAGRRAPRRAGDRPAAGRERQRPRRLERIRAARPEAVAVCAFGQLIREPLLSEFLLLNVHPSLLPRWRGAAPIERAIMAGDERTGVSVMRVTAGLDSGPVALCEEVAIGAEDDFETLSGRLQELGGELLVRALDLQERGELGFPEQEDGGSHLRGEDRSGRAPPRPEPARRRAGAHRARPDPPRRRLPGDGRRQAPRGAAGPRGRRRASSRARSAPSGARCCSAAARGRCGSRSCSRRGAGRCRRTPICAATPCRTVSAKRACI